MARQAEASSEIFFTKKQQWITYSAIAILFTIVLVLEHVTGIRYVIGYFYTGPILLASLYLNRSVTLLVTLASVISTLLNLLFPGDELVQFPDSLNRCIAALALIITAILSDISRRRYQEIIAYQKAQISTQEQLMNMREDFAATLTRDLKTPLLGAMEILSSLQEGQFGNILPEQRQVLGVMAKSHANTIQLLRTMMDVYEYDRKGLTLHLTKVDLVSLAQAAIERLGSLAASRGVKMQLEISDKQRSYWLNADAAQLERVLTNLLSNAINYARRDGEVKVAIAATATALTMHVIDDGAPIPATELQYVFNRFYQGESDRHGTGLGLTLYLCRQIIEAHSGIIWAENLVPQGVLFGFRIPSS